MWVQQLVCSEYCVTGWKMSLFEWACPMFTIAKPDGSLQSLADLREVNKVIKRKPYPIPKILDLLQKLEGFMYATSLVAEPNHN
jgi:hypothetical protein